MKLMEGKIDGEASNFSEVVIIGIVGGGNSCPFRRRGRGISKGETKGSGREGQKIMKPRVTCGDRFQVHRRLRYLPQPWYKRFWESSEPEDLEAGLEEADQPRLKLGRIP